MRHGVATNSRACASRMTLSMDGSVRRSPSNHPTNSRSDRAPAVHRVAHVQQLRGRIQHVPTSVAPALQLPPLRAVVLRRALPLEDGYSEVRVRLRIAEDSHLNGWLRKCASAQVRKCATAFLCGRAFCEGMCVLMRVALYLSTAGMWSRCECVARASECSG